MKRSKHLNQLLQIRHKEANLGMRTNRRDAMIAAELAMRQMMLDQLLV